jgi:iron complex outermembrane receptor protein
MAQTADEDAATSGNDIIVSARRVEERLQDVPISITVLSEGALANNNITSAKDIATYTPGLTTNNRFGSDNTTWTIRGFAQEQRTTATVGTYFADVVAPRGSGATQGGDGAGPGNLFDLSSVQILKGPQGTLQGRNSTGGAVLLVPKRPTDKLEGYVEGSIGDYDMSRVQAVINIPLADTFKVRLGVDRMKRDGYLKNNGTIGFGPNGDAGGSTDYIATRLSVLADLTPDLENYTVASYSKSLSTGVIPKVTRAFYRDPYSGLTGIATGSALDVGQTVTGYVTPNGVLAQNQINSEANCGFWCVTNGVFDSRSETRTWQVINSTKWNASDNLVVKGILSYGEFRGDQSLDLFGLVAPVNGAATIGAATNPFQIRQNVAQTRALPGGTGGTNSQSSFVAELQFQGSGEKFNWQGGAYFENNDPLGKSGTVSATQTPCGPFTGTLVTGAIQVDPTTQCLLGQTGSSLGRIGYSSTETKFTGRALYFQGIYELTDQLKITGGIRYTWDSMESTFNVTNLRYFNSITTAQTFNSASPNNITVPGILNPDGRFAGGAGWCVNNVAFGNPSLASATNPFFAAAEAPNRCLETQKVSTQAPTWLLGLDYKVLDDVLLYAKWSRGYRQGGVTPFGLDGAQIYDKELVDTYEIGAKASWRGAVPGFFNVSGFYNNFRNQQLQIGIQCNPSSSCPQTTAILNVGKSVLQGVEIEAGIQPFEGFKLQASYAYLNTKLKSIADVNAFVLARNPLFTSPPADLRPIPVGAPIPNAQPHKLVISASYDLPLPESIGKITLGGTMVYSSSYRTVSDPPKLASCLLSATGAAQTVNTNGNAFSCSAATPITYGSDFGILPSYTMFNLNVNWANVGGLPVDAAFFMTNVTNEKTFLHVNVQSSSGYLTHIIGEPKMYGVRLKYRFGE